MDGVFTLAGPGLRRRRFLYTLRAGIIIISNKNHKKVVDCQMTAAAAAAPFFFLSFQVERQRREAPRRERRDDAGHWRGPFHWPLDWCPPCCWPRPLLLRQQRPPHTSYTK
jgi:hypothetical protein